MYRDGLASTKQALGTGRFRNRPLQLTRETAGCKIF